ncbi:hypothetical protein U0070_009344, partial [Myodes glareolus]
DEAAEQTGTEVALLSCRHHLVVSREAADCASTSTRKGAVFLEVILFSLGKEILVSRMLCDALAYDTVGLKVRHHNQ